MMKDSLKKRLKQPSTLKGLALLCSGVALAVGQPELFTATVGDSGVQMGGLIGSLITVGLGVWETIRNEVK